jgi:serine/threonine protein kinase
VKLPRPGRLASPEQVEDFLAEARKVARLRHPGIVPVQDVARHQGTYFIISDLIGGCDLAGP